MTLPQTMARRHWLISTGSMALSYPLASLLTQSWAFADEPRQSLNRFPRMVQDYFSEQVHACERRNLAAKAKLQTREDAEAYVRQVRNKVRLSFGPFPQRTPLNPRVTGVIERDTYRIEKVVFESRPNFPVTANLYLPKGGSLPLPSVIGTCGHSLLGKAYESYQSFAQGLARQGYACLIYDPIGQGERLQYVKADLTSFLEGSVSEHLQAGNQQLLVGEFFGMWRAWDGIRALDYLLTRKEVDPKHVGVTGNSGGGTMTTWLAGLDRRWTMAAPCCFVTTFRRNMDNELPADTEQCPPLALALGLDHDDFLAAMAPKPIIILAQEKDFFDVRGAEEAYQRLKTLYRLLGAEQNISLFIGPRAHGFSQENREAMYQWFNRATGIPEAEAEPTLELEDAQTLWCTPQGQVHSQSPRTVFGFTREKAQQLASLRRDLSGDELRAAVHDVLRLPNWTKAVPAYRILRNRSSRNYPRKHFTSYAVKTESGIEAVVYRLSDGLLFSRPPRSSETATLYVSHHSADDELRSEQWLRERIESDANRPFFTCDVRGIGESRANTCGGSSLAAPYGSDFFYASHSLMLDRPYLGMKTWDVMRVVDWLVGFGHPNVQLVAKGWGTLPAMFAALLDHRITSLSLCEVPSSFQAIAEQEHYQWPLSGMLPNVLAHFDLPDITKALRARGCTIVPCDAALSSETDAKLRSFVQATTPPGVVDRVVNIRDFGAVGDGMTLCTRAIQAAVDQCENQGGGSVHLPAGKWLSGTINMKSHVSLVLEAGSLLLGSTNPEDYPANNPAVKSYTDQYVRQSLIFGEQLDDVSIRGSGTIDGNGEAFRWKEYKNRPFVIRFISCQDIVVEGVKLRNSPMWMQHYLACKRLRISGITVWNHATYNNDGMDIDACHDVAISNCMIDSDDDALVFKSTLDRACENVTVTNCHLSSHANAIKMGTESNGGFRNITISNCVICSPRHSQATYGLQRGYAGIALEIVDGGTLDGVVLSNITIRGVTAPIFMRLGNRARPFTQGAPKPGVGSFRNIRLNNIVATGTSKVGCSITGLPGHPIENVSICNVNLGFEGGGEQSASEREVPEEEASYPECTMFGVLPAYGFYCRHVRGLRFESVHLHTDKPDKRHALVCEDVAKMVVDDLDTPNAANGKSVIRLNNVTGALLRGCHPQSPLETFLVMDGRLTARVVLQGNDLRHAKRIVQMGPEVSARAFTQNTNLMDGDE